MSDTGNEIAVELRFPYGGGPLKKSYLLVSTDYLASAVPAEIAIRLLRDASQSGYGSCGIAEHIATRCATREKLRGIFCHDCRSDKFIVFQADDPTRLLCRNCGCDFDAPEEV